MTFLNLSCPPLKRTAVTYPFRGICSLLCTSLHIVTDYNNDTKGELPKGYQIPHIAKVRLDYLGHTGTNKYILACKSTICTHQLSQIHRRLSYLLDTPMTRIIMNLTQTHFNAQFNGAGAWDTIEIAPGPQKERSL